MKAKTGIGLVVLGVVFGLTVMWWWALFGISQNVGIASLFTTLALIGSGTFPVFYE